MIIWVGAHFFEGLILHVSLKKMPQRSKLEFYSNTLFRFNRITGLGSATTLYAGVLLATNIYLGSLSYIFTTWWGILSTVMFIALLCGLLAPVGPKTIGLLFNIALVTAAAAGIAVLAYVALSVLLGGLTSSSWGLAILIGGLVAIALLFIGANQGVKRVQIAIFSIQALSGGVGADEALKSVEKLEKKMLRWVIPENLIALVIVALMVYAANPF